MRQGLLPESEQRYRWAALGLMGAALVLRLLYLVVNTSLDLVPDEAHYWDWSRHLDWSYYSKGPMVAWVNWLSCQLLGSLSIALRGDLVFAVRAPAVLFGSVFLASLYVLTRLILDSEKWAFSAVVIGISLPAITLGSLLLTIDPPFICFWGWALVFTFHAVFRDRNWAWACAGLCVAFGLLSKHTMVLYVPCLALFLWSSPAHRRLLWSSGFWCLALLGALGSVPILLWNVQHDWVTFRHTAGHAGLANGGGIQWFGPVRYLGGQLAVLLGFWFVAWAGAAWKYRPGRTNDPKIQFAWWLSVPIVLFFSLFSFKNGGGEPNWPLPAYATGLVMILASFRDAFREIPSHAARTRRFGIAFTAVGFLLTFVVLHLDWLHPVLAPMAGEPTIARPYPLRRFDPTTRLRGWSELGAEVAKTVAKLRHEGVEPVVVGTHYSIAAEVAFYTRLEVHSIGRVFGDRHTQYDLWRPNPVADPERFLGKTFVIVDTGEPDLVTYFDDMDVAVPVDYAPRGYPLAGWRIHVCRGFRGFDASLNQVQKY